jgi:Type II secretion system (T2SS), protein M subtype b
MSTADSSGAAEQLRMFGARARLGIEILLWRHGLIWAATIVATVASLAVLWWQLVPSQTEFANAQSQLDQTARAVITVGNSVRRANKNAASAPLTLEAVLPPVAQTDARVRRLYSLAARHSLTFPQSSFQTSDDPLIGISRVQMTIPVRATYPELRQFIEALLRELPYATVDQLVFKRHNIGENQVEAELHVSCWFRTSAYPAAPATRSVREAEASGAHEGAS